MKLKYEYYAWDDIKKQNFFVININRINVLVFKYLSFYNFYLFN